MLRTGVAGLHRPALACGSLVEPGTRALRYRLYMLSRVFNLTVCY